jgi:hypothetical protein
MTPVRMLTAAMTMPSAAVVIAFASHCNSWVYVRRSPDAGTARLLVGEQLLQRVEMLRRRSDHRAPSFLLNWRGRSECRNLETEKF